MALTYGVLYRGSDILYEFDYIAKFPSIPSSLNGITELNMPGLLNPILMDNGNVKSIFDLEIVLINKDAYDPTAEKGTTGTIFEQYYDARRMIDDLGIFISGSAPTVATGTGSTQRYNTSAASIASMKLAIYMDIGNSTNPFSSNYDLYSDDYILDTRDGIYFNAVPISIRLDSTDIAHNLAKATIKFQRIRQILPFRTSSI